jgi:hypothetical protein
MNPSSVIALVGAASENETIATVREALATLGAFVVGAD